MRIKHKIIASLLRLYPAAWRSEYGPELTDMLLSVPLGARVIGDVLWNGLRQRVRTAEPSTLAGLAMMLVILSGFAWNIASPPPHGYGWTMMLQQSSKTLPAVVVKPFSTELYVLLLVFCGCWTYLRNAGRISQSGIAAMKVTFVAGIPVMLAGVLMLSGVLSVVALGNGDAPTTLQQHGFAYTYFNAQHQPPSPLSVLLSPLFALPQSWIWGVLGAYLGRCIAPRIRAVLPVGHF